MGGRGVDVEDMWVQGVGVEGLGCRGGGLGFQCLAD